MLTYEQQQALIKEKLRQLELLRAKAQQLLQQIRQLQQIKQ